ncbi:hypothetical protein OESDEN_10416 [Oesophagostomum dentatum]|uniref:Alpha-carbonic anhydrase domain-containing protein n=1 Tax=Oesophagostomum dentatum TaxID=61180 RepID=A0A0B1T0R7_OESDE|nr:hypothetical protein OESDEN_10416 [Oesophagostomum dentatum]
MYDIRQQMLIFCIFYVLLIPMVLPEENIQWSQSDSYWNGFCSTGKRQSPIDLDIGNVHFPPYFACLFSACM